MSTASTAAPVESLERDAADLAGFGYQQQLHRRLGSYASFAAGFSFVSILTTVTEFFYFGYGAAGPAFFWTWPMVFLGQMCVALVFADLAARYPIAGCIYQWSRRVAGELVGWFAGWMMLLGQIISVSAAAIALQMVLPSIWTGFQLVGPATSSPSVSDNASNAVIYGVILIAVTTVINVIGIRVMSVINSIGVTCELVGIVVLVVALFTQAHRGPGVVLHAEGAVATGDHASFVWPFLISALMAGYVMYGFDSAGELSEETRAPRRTAPRAIIRALAVSGIGGALVLLAALMAAPYLVDNTTHTIANSPLASLTGGLAAVISTLPTALAKIIFIDIAVAVTVCTLAIQTAGTRLMFSQSRDRVLPFSRVLGRINPRTGTPIAPSIVVGVVAAAMLFIDIGQEALFGALGSVALVVVYLAYLGVTTPALVRRLRGLPLGEQDAGARHFSLGRWGLPVNLLAVAWGVFMVINIGWPRAYVYDPTGGHWYLQYLTPLFLGGALVLGALAYGWRRRELRADAGVGAAVLEAASD